MVIISKEKSPKKDVLRSVERVRTRGKRLEKCRYCQGNEKMTPPADLVLIQREGALIKFSGSESETAEEWSVRSFLDESPIVSTDPLQTYGDSPLYSEPGYGYHYVLVATPDHSQVFGKMSVDQWINILSAVQDKVKWLYTKKGVSYVAVFINYGERSGATVFHPHLQIIALPRVPPLIEQEAATFQKSFNEMGVCPMCSVINIEQGGPRQILVTDQFLAFSPWAPTHAYEFWVFPRKHQTSFVKATQKEIGDLALILRSTLGGLSKALNDPSFNLVFHVSSEKKTTKQIHWHVEVYPHLSDWSALERGVGIYVNRVLPEEGAKTLGASSRREFAELTGIS